MRKRKVVVQSLLDVDEKRKKWTKNSVLKPRKPLTKVSYKFLAPISSLTFLALKSRTKKARNDLLTNGKKSSRKLEKTQMQGKGGSQTWDWEETGNAPLDVIAEEAAEAPADNPLVNLD